MSFPMDYDRWRPLRDREIERLIVNGIIERGPAPDTLRTPGKNFLADEKLGTWKITGADIGVEMNDVTMMGHRYVGLSFATPELHWSGGVCASFAEVVISIERARTDGPPAGASVPKR